VLPVEEHNEMLEEFTALVQADDGRHPVDQARVLVAGSFCEQPPLGLIKTLERAGCYIVDDDLLLGAHMIEGRLAGSGDDAFEASRILAKCPSKFEAKASGQTVL